MIVSGSAVVKSQDPKKVIQQMKEMSNGFF